ncbi:hypothetical protein D9M70_596800 [compost metagenome]
MASASTRRSSTRSFAGVDAAVMKGNPGPFFVSARMRTPATRSGSKRKVLPKVTQSIAAMSATPLETASMLATWPPV